MGCDCSGRKTERAFKALFAIFPLGVFLVASYLAWQDRGWEALRIAIALSPAANLLLMVLGAFAAFIVQQLNPGTRLGSMMSWALGLPPFVAFATAVVIFMMGLHGC
jgi:hypothetical protein